MEWIGPERGSTVQQGQSSFWGFVHHWFFVVPGLGLGKASCGSAQHRVFVPGTHVVLGTGMATIMPLSWDPCHVTHGECLPACLCLGGHMELSQDAEYL